MTTKRASRAQQTRAPKDQETELLELLENYVSSTMTTSLIDALRSRGFTDAYITASLLAGAKTLIRGMENKATWSGLLELMAKEVAHGQ
jgi:hypothetical protein